MASRKHSRNPPNQKISSSLIHNGDSGSATPTSMTLKTNKTPLGADIAAKLTGTPLEPLAPVITLLPKQLATLIEKKTNSMLSLYLKLKEREESLNLYDKENTNPDTGETVALHPKCCRKVNPITCSRYLKEDIKMQGIVKQFNELIEIIHKALT